jgi:hypothetical protein
MKEEITKVQDLVSDVDEIDNTSEQSREFRKVRYNQAIYKWITMIALLSVLNSVLEVLNVPLSFPVGFGINYMVTGFLSVLNQPQTSIAIGGLAAALLVAGSFFLLGEFFRKGKNWALYVIFALYTLDTLLTLALLLISGDAIGLLINVGFHIYAIVRMVQLFRVYRKL